jgi:hypothetical protein
MKTKLFLTFALAGLSFASARSFDITLDAPARAGSAQLAAGHYSVALDKTDQSKVIFKNTDTGKSMEATGTIEKVEKKFDVTSVTLHGVNGTTQIQEIDLGGTPTKVEFK